MDRVSGSRALSQPVARPLAPVLRDGLWRRNAGLVQLLGLCPLLAVSNQVSTALGLAIATAFVLVISNGAASLLRPVLTPETRIAMFVVVIAGAVTIVELLVRAYAHELHGRLGIFLPLIVTNCAILARAEAFASRSPLVPSLVDGLATGIGFWLVLVVLGACRELIGQGTLFANLDLVLGPWAQSLELRFADGGLLLALLPPGAFIILGLLVAAHRWHGLKQDRSPGTTREQLA
ncbi:MAG: electron transport complex subunit E [Pseudomonadota bacterium]